MLNNILTKLYLTIWIFSPLEYKNTSNDYFGVKKAKFFLIFLYLKLYITLIYNFYS